MTPSSSYCFAYKPLKGLKNIETFRRQSKDALIIIHVNYKYCWQGSSKVKDCSIGRASAYGSRDSSSNPSKSINFGLILFKGKIIRNKLVELKTESILYKSFAQAWTVIVVEISIGGDWKSVLYYTISTQLSLRHWIVRFSPSQKDNDKTLKKGDLK